VSIEFLVTCLVVVITPGTGMVYTLVCSLSRGASGSFFGALGSTLSIVPHIAAAVFGLAALFHTSALAFQTVKYAGVAYLLYLAWRVLRDHSAMRIEEKRDSRSHGEVVFHGILASLLNPKLSVFFLAFLPQFIDVHAASPVADMITLGAVFMLMTFVVFLAVGLAATTVRDEIAARPSVMTWMRRIFAGTFVALGARLAFAER
jgi:threonine/homoserine/homoserine lactone efflux protein